MLSVQKLKTAHKRASLNRTAILKSKECRCFYCLGKFPPSKIQEWIDKDQTAICPKCSVDSVIGDASGIDMSLGFFKRMKQYWFFEGS